MGNIFSHEDSGTKYTADSDVEDVDGYETCDNPDGEAVVSNKESTNNVTFQIDHDLNSTTATNIKEVDLTTEGFSYIVEPSCIDIVTSSESEYTPSENDDNFEESETSCDNLFKVINSFAEEDSQTANTNNNNDELYTTAVGLNISEINEHIAEVNTTVSKQQDYAENVCSSFESCSETTSVVSGSTTSCDIRSSIGSSQAISWDIDFGEPAAKASKKVVKRKPKKSASR